MAISETSIPRDNGLDEHFHALETWLLQQRPLWREQPYKHERPAWGEQRPQLQAALLALTEAEHEWLRSDDRQLGDWLARFVPAFARLPELLRLPTHAGTPLAPHKHLDWAVPGRKWAQIQAFAENVETASLPLMEWCGGKGHLGRLLSATRGLPVTTLERDGQLCASGRELSQRAGVAQDFLQLDVFTPALPGLQAHQVVALHACGGLHRRLLRQAASERSPAIDLVPCCYHLYGEAEYRPFSSDARLRLQRDDLRLAVTETVTSRAREVRLRDREMAWKLGFLHLISPAGAGFVYRPLAPIDKQWLNGDFEQFCLRLAGREGIVLEGAPDYAGHEAYGWRRQAVVMRLSLPRHAVRRALELWLVVDMARYLQGQGYEIELSTFCDSSITPRNILLSARLREQGAGAETPTPLDAYETGVSKSDQQAQV